MMHADAWKAIRKLSDANSRLFGYTADGRPTFDGSVVHFNRAMDSTFASTKRTVAFGNFKLFQIVDVGPTRLRVLDETRGDSDQLTFIASQRSDGGLVDPAGNGMAILVH
jgi:HK97 family phage major capsid protein